MPRILLRLFEAFSSAWSLLAHVIEASALLARKPQEG